MEVVYTRHAKGRMRWRGITKQEVEAVIQEPERREATDYNRFHYFRHIGGRDLRVTCIIEGLKHIIISAVDKSD